MAWVLENQKKRFQFLVKIYEEQKKAPENIGYNMIEIGQKCGLDETDVREVAVFLHREGLIEFPILGPIVKITHKGILELEKAFSNPGSATDHFPAYIIQEISMDIRYENPPAEIVKTNTEVKALVHGNEKKWDVFISHASEDKESIARPLAQKLQQKGLRVWYDENNIKWGSHLTISIDEGLRNSRYGIVIFSKSFFKKKWTQHELEGLFALMMATGRNLILPIRHNITQIELTQRAPMFANIFNKSSEDGVDNLVEEVCKIMKSETNTELQENTIPTTPPPNPTPPEFRTKGEIMWETAYREHSKSIGYAIFQGWNKSSGILANFSYRNGIFRRTEPKEKTINELQYADYAKLHLKAGYPEVLTLTQKAQEVSLDTTNRAEATVREFEVIVMEAIRKACPDLPGIDHYDSNKTRFYYKINAFAAVFEEADDRLSGSNKRLPKIEVTSNITGPDGAQKATRFLELSLSQYTIARSNEEELEALSRTLDALASDARIRELVSKYRVLENERRDSLKANELHNAVLNIGQDSKDMPIEGEGSCTICARLFRDLLGK